MTAPDAEVKACCVQAYSHDAVAMLLGDSYHPGGTALTRVLAARLALGAGRRVLDVACGPGATSILLASEYRVEVDGIDLAAPVLDRARTAAAAADVNGLVRFHQADSEAIPFLDSTFDAIVCECALCLFADKARAAAEFMRVLRPGGRVGIADVTLGEPGLPTELTDLVAHVACIAVARSTAGYTELLTAAGLNVTVTQQHNTAITRMIDHIETRLALVRITAPDRLAASGLDRRAVADYLGRVRRAVAEDRIGYALLVAEKPAGGQRPGSRNVPAWSGFDLDTPHG